MTKYLVEQILDAGVVVGYKIKSKPSAKHLPRGNNHLFVEGVDTKYPKIEINEDGNLSIVEDLAPKQLKGAYVLMDNEVANEASLKVGTKNRESILASISAYQLRVMIPERYIDLGLIAEIEIGNFLISDPLDDAAKIKEYYTEVLFQLDAYRIGKIKDYLDLKASLGF